MTCSETKIKSYAAYVSDLSKVAESFEGLNTFFSEKVPTLDDLIEQGSFRSLKDDENPEFGSITVADFLSSTLELQTFRARGEYSLDDRNCIQDLLNIVHSDCKVRLIFVDYHRQWNSGCYVGIDKTILDLLATTYQIHPSILQLHFGSNYLLDAYYHKETDQDRYGLCHTVRKQCLLLHYGHGFLTASYGRSPAQNDLTTIIVIARNDGLTAQGSKIYSDLVVLDSPFPDPLDWDIRPKKWTNSIFLKHLALSGNRDLESIKKNPMECLTVYGFISAEVELDRMHLWEEKVDETRSIAGDLTVRYREQEDQVQRMKSNERSMRMFAGISPSRRYQMAVETLSSTLAEAEQQFESLRLMMTYRASQASLRESKTSVQFAQLGIQQARQSLEQNNRMKILTQLALVFIPISTIASLFGMNLTVLASGSAQIWMFIVAVVIAYAVALTVWAILSDPSRRLIRSVINRFHLQKPASNVENTRPESITQETYA